LQGATVVDEKKSLYSDKLPTVIRKYPLNMLRILVTGVKEV